jgi:hypothetical protein
MVKRDNTGMSGTTAKRQVNTLAMLQLNAALTHLPYLAVVFLVKVELRKKRIQHNGTQKHFEKSLNLT